jgi:hypothetical protein
LFVPLKLTFEKTAAEFRSIPIPCEEDGENCLVSSLSSVPANPYLVTYSSFISTFMFV